MLIQAPPMQEQRQWWNPPPSPLQTLPPSISFHAIQSQILLLFLLLFFFFPAASGQSPATVQPNNATDLAALLALKSQADPGGALSASWVVDRGGGADFCGGWRGVTCSSRRQRVTQLSLTGASLAGTMPPHIGNLSFLVSLDLSNNSLAGPLPGAALARLRRLRYLNLSYNSFTGSVPAELGDLPQIRAIRLGENELGGEVPPSLGRLTPLQVLWLNGNKLSGNIPEALGRLPDLQNLNLQSNKLTGAIPGAILRMASLQVLALGDNMLSGELPEDLQLPNVYYLNLSSNEIGGRLPRALGRLSSLQDLHLSRNPLTGEIPAEMGSLSQLQRLVLENTNLAGTIPPEMGNLTGLQLLSMEGAQIEGEIPPELGKLAGLRWLSFASNRLTGGFPTAAVSNMSSLTTLVLANNSMSGKLPDDLGLHLPRTLQNLYINMNKFNGEIPGSLSNASMLSVLELSYNNFQGTVPPSLGGLQQLAYLTVTDNQLSGGLDFLAALSSCRNLTDLNLRYNRFSGTLPEATIGNFTNLIRFVGQGNLLKGSIPSSFGNLTHMQTLVLSENMLSGPIPPAVAALPLLQRLYLQVNRLEGPIPPEVGLARNLGLLYLQKNSLSGPIPDSIGNLTALTELYMAENNLASVLPPGLWRLTGLFNLNLSHNRLEGSLPDTMKSLSKVTHLDFSANRLSGIIPDAIGEIQMLEDLSLASNDLSGPLTSKLGSLISLKMLDLSSNALSGSIPPSMAKLRYLERLNLSFNKLEGEIPNDGAFAKVSPGISNESFAGNLGLCGAPWFGFPPCKAPRGKGGRQRHIVVASVAAAALCLLIVLVLLMLSHRRRKNTRSKSLDSLAKEDMAGLPMISRHALAMATDGFSEANVLGAGSFGKVYRGRLADGTLAAVKVLDLQMGEAAWLSFDAECRVMRAVRHRNLVGVITACSNLDFRALVLQFMPNGNLDRWIHSTDDGGGARLSLLQRVDVVADVASALEYLHHGCSEPVVHCDLKPSNVLLDGEMVAHVGDFGISKVVVEHSKSATGTGMPGTFGYMAPEYGTVGRVTTKGDVYSYGILLLETFTGVRPTDPRFNGDLNLRRWVASAFPDAIADVVDDSLFADQLEEAHSSSGTTISISSSIRGSRGGEGGRGNSIDVEQQRLRCLVAVLELGLTCSSESPKERPGMVEVAAKQKKIRGELLLSSSSAGSRGQSATN